MIDKIKRFLYYTTMTNTTNKITLEIKNTQPVELMDLANCLLSLGDEYRRFIASAEPNGIDENKELKLYVEEVRKGSILVDLVVIGTTMYTQESFSSLFEFINFIKTLFDYLQAKTEKPAQPLEAKTLKNAKNITDIVVKDSKGSINFINNGSIIIGTDFSAANVIQNQANKLLEDLAEPEKKEYFNVVLYLYQVRNESNNEVGDMGIIESIVKRPVKLFMEEPLKKKILEDKDLLHNNYIVDVEVSYKKGQPILYFITKLHEKFPD